MDMKQFRPTRVPGYTPLSSVSRNCNIQISFSTCQWFPVFLANSSVHVRSR